MLKVVLTDTSILGQLAHPKESARLLPWLRRLAKNKVEVRIPEVADYELRRELIRAGLVKSLHNLNQLKVTFGYLPITTAVMLRAADLWAAARHQGTPTADPRELDCDVILAAQGVLLIEAGYDVVVATTNVGHLSLFVSAKRWQDIP
jgi:predicted nucleic acid-binding protein